MDIANLMEPPSQQRTPSPDHDAQQHHQPVPQHSRKPRRPDSDGSMHSLYSVQSLTPPRSPSPDNNARYKNLPEVKEQGQYLPIANVARIMKAALPDNAKIAKEAKVCMQECVSEFLSFITSEASEKVAQERRNTISGEDVLFATASLGFENYAEAMKIYLARYRENQHQQQGRNVTSSTAAPSRPHRPAEYAGSTSALYEAPIQLPRRGSEDSFQQPRFVGGIPKAHIVQEVVMAGPATRDMTDDLTASMDALEKAMRDNFSNQKSPAPLQIRIVWEVPYCLFKNYALNTRLGDVMTITGSSDNAIAISCRGYVRKFLSQLSGRFFECLELFLVKVVQSISGPAEDVFIERSEYGDSDIVVQLVYEHLVPITGYQTTAESIIILKIEAPIEERVQIAALMSWLCAAIRKSPHQTMCLSTVTSRFATTNHAMIQVAPLREVSFRENCWHHLFSNSVIAAHYQLSARPSGRGLEIQLGDMLSLARSFRILELRRCLVAEASQNLLVVMAKVVEENDSFEGNDRSQDDDCFQWHLEDKRCISSSDRKRRKLSATEILSRPEFSSCVTNVDFETLKKARHFLGWTSSVEINLGTSANVCQDFTLSGAQGPLHTRTRLTAYNFGVGLSHLGAITLGATATTSSIATRYAREARKDLLDTLQDLESESIILFDYKSKIAWHLPVLNVLLHMIQILCAYRGLRAYSVDSAKRRPIPVAERKPGGTAAVLEAINTSLDLRLKKKTKNTTFAESLEELCLNLELGQQFANDAWDAAIKHARAAPRCIVGFEIMELLKGQSILKVKEEEVNQPWAHLAQDGGLVLFCKNIGQAITPSPKASLCVDWQQVPPGMFYLAACGHGLRDLVVNLDRSRLSDRLEWELNSRFKHDDDCSNDTCSVLQFLRSVNCRVSQPDIWVALSKFECGGYIFHHRESTMKRLAALVKPRTPKKPKQLHEHMLPTQQQSTETCIRRQSVDADVSMSPERLSPKVNGSLPYATSNCPEFESNASATSMGTPHYFRDHELRNDQSPYETVENTLSAYPNTSPSSDRTHHLRRAKKLPRPKAVG